MYKSFKWAMAYFAPSGIGIDSPSKAEVINSPSLDATRILELRYAIRVLRMFGGMKEVPLWLQGQGVMGGVTLYAGIFEPDIIRFDLHDLIKSHKGGSFLENAFSVIDVPQAVAMALEKSQVILYQDDNKGWDYPATVSKKLKWGNKLQIRTPPPKK